MASLKADINSLKPASSERKIEISKLESEPTPWYCKDSNITEMADLVRNVGARVTRGQDWDFHNLDGGPGELGTVYKIEKNSRYVYVLWDKKFHLGPMPYCIGGNYETLFHS